MSPAKRLWRLIFLDWCSHSNYNMRVCEGMEPKALNAVGTSDVNLACTYPHRLQQLDVIQARQDNSCPVVYVFRQFHMCVCECRELQEGGGGGGGVKGRPFKEYMLNVRISLRGNTAHCTLLKTEICIHDQNVIHI